MLVFRKQPWQLIIYSTKMRRVNQLSDPPGSQARQWSNIKIVLVMRGDDDDEEVCRMKIRCS